MDNENTQALPLALISWVFSLIVIAIGVQFMVERLTGLFPGQVR